MVQVTYGLPQSISFERYDEPNQTCPSCATKGLSIFYGMADIPVYSNRLMADRREALQCPRGDLQLGFCRRCGFITNTCFHPGDISYTDDYEGSQGFSGCFSQFAQTIVEKLIQRYHIYDKTIVEIGCGDGGFLSLLCEKGNNRGIGIDPAGKGRGISEALSGRMEFIEDYYSEKHADLGADVIYCRHTLEHIAATRSFLQTVRRNIGPRKDVVVIFELPDVLRVLREGAFWDIYYEHCSYFTGGSLSRLFRRCGFAIDDLAVEYDGQYLILTAYPAEEAVAVEEGDDMASLIFAQEEFRDVCARRIEYWHSTIGRLAQRKRRVVLWGSGSKAVAFLTTLQAGAAIDYVVDINPYKQNQYMPGTGQQIVAPEFLRDYQPHDVIVMNPIYCREIQQDLNRTGVAAELLPV